MLGIIRLPISVPVYPFTHHYPARLLKQAHLPRLRTHRSRPHHRRRGRYRRPWHGPSKSACVWNPSHKCSTKACHNSSRASASPRARQTPYRTFDTWRASGHACACNAFAGFWSPSRVWLEGGLCCCDTPVHSSNMEVVAFPLAACPGGTLGLFCTVIHAPTYASTKQR